jgi:hypothetical protein
MAWVQVGHGLHSLSPSGQSELHAWQLVLPPSGRFTHLTAASAYGLWLPPVPADLPVFASIDHEDNRPRRRGLRVARQAALGPVLEEDGLRLDEPAQALLACARDLSPLDMVVLVDAALHLELCSAGDLAVAAAGRRRGAPRLRQALVLADGRSESAWETLLRVLHVTCEVAVEPQFELVDENGSFIARGDLWLRGTRAIHEYDGHHHLQKRRQRKDLARARRVGNTTWIRRGYTSMEVLHQAVTILRDADLSLGRPHRPERIRAWHALLAESLFTPSGQALFRRRLGLGPEQARPATGQR